MNKSTQYTAIGIIVLLVLTNIGMLIAMWAGPSQKAPPSRHDAPLAVFLREELKLTKVQMDEFKVLADEHHRQMQHTQHELQLLKKLMFDLMKQGNSADDVKHIADKIGELQSNREMNTFVHFQELRKMCNEEQKDKFDDLIQDVLRTMGPKPPRQGGRPGKGQRPPRQRPPGP